jgi:type II secretory pathway component PulF
VLREAGEVAAEGNKRFLEALRDVENRMQGYGRSLTDSLRRHPRYFDPLYIALLQSAETRRQTRQCLDILGKG